MTREELHAIARKVALQRQIVDGYNIVNVYGKSPEERADLDASAQISRDILNALEHEYNLAMRDFISTNGHHSP